MSERQRQRDATTADARSPGRERVEAELLGGVLDLDREVNRISAMGEPTRFVLLYHLTEDGPLPTSELMDRLDRRQNNLYHHLDVLEEAGLIGKYEGPDGRTYELSPLAETFVPAVFESIGRRAAGR